MPWKKLLAWATKQIDEALRQKLEFVLEENQIHRDCLYGHSPRWEFRNAHRHNHKGGMARWAHTGKTLVGYDIPATKETQTAGAQHPVTTIHVPDTPINGAEIGESDCASAKSRRRRSGSALKYNIAHFSCGAFPHNRSRNT